MENNNFWRVKIFSQAPALTEEEAELGPFSLPSSSWPETEIWRQVQGGQRAGTLGGVQTAPTSSGDGRRRVHWKCMLS